MFHQEIEFTFESDDPADLYLLQTRDMALKQHIDLPTFAAHGCAGERPGGDGDRRRGRRAERALRLHGQDIGELAKRHPGDPIILLRPGSVPDDLPLILRAAGILTARGGATSHAALAAQHLGRVCVVGCRQLVVDERQGRSLLAGQPLETGQWISIDGGDGSVYLGRHATKLVQQEAGLGATRGDRLAAPYTPAGTALGVASDPPRSVDRQRVMLSPATRCLLLAGLCALVACQQPRPSAKRSSAAASNAEDQVDGLFDEASYRRAEAERAEFYEREVERLRADLPQAEASLVAMESGLRGFHTGGRGLRAGRGAHRPRAGEPERALAPGSRGGGARQARGGLAAAPGGARRARPCSSRRAPSASTENLRAEVRQVAGWEQKSLVVGDAVELRTAPSGEADVVDTLVAQTPVFPERSQNSWTLVRTPSGRIGWVRASGLSAP